MLPIQTLHRHSDSVNALIVNGDLLLSGSEDTEIKVNKLLSLVIICLQLPVVLVFCLFSQIVASAEDSLFY